MKQRTSGWRHAVGAVLAEWRKARPRRLTVLAQGALALERLARVFAPAFIIAASFVALSWTGIWLGAPTFVRVLGVAALIGALAGALARVRAFSWPAPEQARSALEAGLSDAPASALADSLANNSDPRTRSLWRLHQLRAERLAIRLRPLLPSPRLWTFDRYALGALAALTLCATGLLAGPEKYARVAAAFDWRWRATDSAPSRIDAWIDPPGYTGKPPIVLPLQNASGTSSPVPAPAGSNIVVRASNAKEIRVAIDGGVEPAPAANGAAKGTVREQLFVLRSDGRLSISQEGSEIASFTLRAIPDQPPKITPLAPPQTNLHGSFVLSYRIEDDYGARDAQAAAKLTSDAAPNTRPLVQPPGGSLDLPAGPDGLGEAKTTLDWSDSPYAGAQVDLVLSVHDEGGNEGEAVIRNYVLPGKVFKNPLALALAEQRRVLALDAHEKDKVVAAIDALMIAPETFTPDAAVYLGLRYIHDSLRDARSDSELVAVVDLLWEMALKIEEGDVSQAERDLRGAENALREALKHGATPEEIAKLTEQLQKALDQYLKAMQDKAAKNSQVGESEAGNQQSVTAKDLKSMLDQLAEAAKDGDKNAAMEMLDRMEDMLENLRTANQSEKSSQAAKNRRTMRDIDNLMREQQKLRDDTYSRERGEPRGNEPEPSGDEAQNGQDEYQQDRGGQTPRSGKGKSQSQPGQTQGQDEKADQDELGERQGQLGEKLGSLRKRAEGEGGKNAEGLAEAADAMKQAEQALKNGDNEAALDAQGRALEGLRKGAAEIAQQGGENGPPDDQEQAGEKNGQGLRGQNGEGRFGRANRQNNIDATAVQKARKVLEELRRRLADPSRAREELDYLERLIRPD